MAQIYRVVWNMSYLGQQCVNVFHYGDNGSLALAAHDLMDGFVIQNKNAYKTMLNVGVMLDSIYVIDVANPANWAFGTIGEACSVGVAGNGLSAFYAWGFRINCTGSAIRHGYKRLPGVDESFVASGQPTATAIGFASILQGKFITNIPQAGRLFEPLIVRYDNSHPPNIVLTASPSSCDFTGTTTQNTRKR